MSDPFTASGQIRTEPAEDIEKPMRLRGDAPRVTRLSRKVLAGLGGVTSLVLGGALIYALQTRDTTKTADELFSTENRATADGLVGLPKDYSTIPKLGPPLPGDLGRPILDAQRRGMPVPNPIIVPPDPTISAEEQRRLQEIEAARMSKIFAADRKSTRLNSSHSTLSRMPSSA